MILVALCIPFPSSALCDDMLTMLACATRWLFVHLYRLAYMSMHEFCLLVCRPCFNTMKLWISDPNLHFPPVDTIFCLLFRLFSFLLVCLLSSSFLYHAYHAYLLYAFSYALCIFSFYGFLFLPLHVHIWSEDAWN